MRLLFKAALIGAGVETLLCICTGLFGHVGPCSANSVVGVALYLHLPGVLIVERFSPDSMPWVGLAFVIASGVLQFTGLIWIALAIRQARSGRLKT